MKMTRRFVLLLVILIILSLAITRWDIMNVTDVHPSPVSVRTSQSSAFLSRRSRLTENKIDQCMMTIISIIIIIIQLSVLWV